MAVLDYSSIRPQQHTKSTIFFTALSVGLAAVPFIAWALHFEDLAPIAFLFLPWFGLWFAIGGIKEASYHWLAVVLGTIGATVNGVVIAVLIFACLFGVC